MSDVDTSREAVERLAAHLDAQWPEFGGDVVRALLAERDAARADRDVARTLHKVSQASMARAMEKAEGIGFARCAEAMRRDAAARTFDLVATMTEQQHLGVIAADEILALPLPEMEDK
jgi:hypothetical protein